MPNLADTLDERLLGTDQRLFGGLGDPRASGDAMKFTYATGDRPLSGYTIKRGIGGGGFGEVYYAVSDAGKEVALKRVQRHLQVELRGVQQCLNLKHSNLLHLFDVRQDDQDEAWVVMEYIVGESLRDLLERNPEGLSTRDVDHWLDGMLGGVAHLHDRGIVHRDLKPGNIFCDSGVIKVGDYGLSKFISCSHRSGQTESVGTVHYMAPEIGRGNYGKQIDIYALGVMLYEMLTGQVPFDGESTQEIIMRHLTMEPDLSRLPVVYRDVVRRALQKDPQQRFADVPEMQAALVSAREAVEAQLLGPVQNAIPLEGVALPVAPQLSVITAKAVLPQATSGVSPTVTRTGNPTVTPPVVASAPVTLHPPKSARQVALLAWVNKPRGEQCLDLLHGMLMSCPYAVLLSVVGVLLFRQPDSTLDYDLSLGSWLMLTITLGSWLTLGLGKIWEARAGDAIQRRVVMLAAGLLLGAISWSCREFLLLDQPERLITTAPLVDSWLSSRGSGEWPQPRPLAVVIYCGALFFLSSFWKQASGVRTTRVRIWPLLIAACIAFLVGCVVPFWSPWGPFLAVTISLTTQLAARWCNPLDPVAARWAPTLHLCLATCLGLAGLLAVDQPARAADESPQELSVKPDESVAPSKYLEWTPQVSESVTPGLKREGDVDYLVIRSLTKSSEREALEELPELMEISFKQYLYQQFGSALACQRLALSGEQLQACVVGEPLVQQQGEQTWERHYRATVKLAFSQKFRDTLLARWQPVVRSQRLQGLGVLSLAIFLSLLILRFTLPKMLSGDVGGSFVGPKQLRYLTLVAILFVVAMSVIVASPLLLIS